MFGLKYEYLDEANQDGGENSAAGTDSDDSKASIEDLQAQIAALQSKNNELLNETKTAKAKRREAEEKARQETEEAARKAGDFETLHQSSEAEREKLYTELSTLKGGIAEEKKNNAAMKLATELADGANAELLSEFIARRLQWNDGKINVTDQTGALTVSSLDDLKKEFSTSAKYASLLKGSKASGGGASGGQSGGAASTEMGRSDFDALTPAARMKFVKDGGKVFDNA